MLQLPRFVLGPQHGDLELLSHLQGRKIDVSQYHNLWEFQCTTTIITFSDNAFLKTVMEVGNKKKV